MEIKSLDKVITGTANATIRLDSGDTVSIAYTSHDGKTNIINVTAQHLVLMAVHEQTEKAIICRPSGVSTVN
jgi:hypothetical protein